MRSITFTYTLFLGTTDKGRQQSLYNRISQEAGRKRQLLTPFTAQADAASFPSGHSCKGPSVALLDSLYLEIKIKLLLETGGLWYGKAES